MSAFRRTVRHTSSAPIVPAAAPGHCPCRVRGGLLQGAVIVLGIIRDLFSPRVRLPQDVTVRIPRSARKAAHAQSLALKETLAKISDLPGIADIPGKKRVPKGFYGLAETFLRQYDAYEAAIQKAWGPGAAASSPEDGWRKPGTLDGRELCKCAPTPVSGIEALVIFRSVRDRRDFQTSGNALAVQGQQLFEDLKQHNRGNKNKVCNESSRF